MDTFFDFLFVRSKVTQCSMTQTGSPWGETVQVREIKVFIVTNYPQNMAWSSLLLEFDIKEFHILFIQSWEKHVMAAIVLIW